MTTLDWLLGKATEKGADLNHRPIEIPDVGRDDLAQWFREWGFARGVEIGVKAGQYSEVLCKANPEGHVWSVDPWLVREEYHDRRGQKVFDEYERQARERLGPLNCTILKMKSSEAIEHFEPKSLDYAYIDGHHNLYNAIHDIHFWTQRVAPGGIIALHDYVHYRGTGVHVIEAVQAYTTAYRIHPWFVLGTKEKVAGKVRDRHRTCLWVRPEWTTDEGSYDPTHGGQV